MTRLFAAIDAVGEMRFVGEVPRGSACNCFCPECHSPLIARQGVENEWHFAHESGQERPECEPGAANMLRRLAVEYLKTRPKILLPRYTQTAYARSDVRVLTEQVSWDGQFIGSITWLEQASRSDPVACSRMDNGIEAYLFVQISDDLPKHLPTSKDAVASMVFHCSVPVTSDLRKREYAERHLQRHGNIVWRHQPDVFGLMAAAQSRLLLKARELDAADARAHNRQQEEASKRQAEMSRLRLEQDAAAQRAAALKLLPKVDPLYSWAPSRKPDTSFIFYRLHDGSAWVVYTLSDGCMGIAAWPVSEEGWDEALPPSVGIVDSELGIYRASSAASHMIYLGEKSISVRTSRNPADFEGY